MFEGQIHAGKKAFLNSSYSTLSTQKTKIPLLEAHEMIQVRLDIFRCKINLFFGRYRII